MSADYKNVNEINYINVYWQPGNFSIKSENSVCPWCESVSPSLVVVVVQILSFSLSWHIFSLDGISSIALTMLLFRFSMALSRIVF